MRISVNLASRPFVELRPLFARLRLAMMVLALMAVGLGFALRALNAKAAVARGQMDALKTKTLGYQQERMANEARMRQPQNMAVLERSQFLNAVFARKSFSWTAVMMDLERVLPAGVQVTSIEPAVTKTGDVNIRLRVSGDRERAVQLVRNLETSQRFVAPRLASEQAQTQEGNRGASAMQVAGAGAGAVQFDILSGYNPLPETRRREVAEKEGNGSAAGSAAATPDAGKKSARARVPGSKRVKRAKNPVAANVPAQQGAPR